MSGAGSRPPYDGAAAGPNAPGPGSDAAGRFGSPPAFGDSPLDIAIVGWGGVFPGSTTLEEFWQLIADGRDAVQEAPAGRWLIPPEQAWSPSRAADRVVSKRACFIDDLPVDELDLPPTLQHLVPQLDPLFTLALLTAQRALRHATDHSNGYDPERTGVIFGNIALPSDHSSRLTRELLQPLFDASAPDASTLAAATVDASNANRERTPPHFPQPRTPAEDRYVAGLPAALVAQAFGLRGRHGTLDAACASSLYALRLAADELRSGRADAMLAGGMSRPDSLYTQMGFSQLKALSPEGVCAPFDHKGSGLVVGEGAALFLLKRLEDAVQSGDSILGVIRGIGLSNDVGGSLLAPQNEGQMRALDRAYRQAGWKPDSVDLIECHATGTPLGDATEIRSLEGLWQAHGVDASTGQCVVGSVKSNVGHLLTGAGAAGLTKVLLALQKQQLPPTAHFEHPGNKLDLSQSPFRVLAHAEPWPRRSGDLPRRAAVSAFGFGGINAHVLIEEWCDATVTTAASTPATPADTRLTATSGSISAGSGDAEVATEFDVVGLASCLGDDADNWSWFGWEQHLPADLANIRGRLLDGLRVSPTQFRIPPRELEELLPQQLLMLLAADSALKDVGNIDYRADRAGVFIGIELDPNTTNFSFRWGTPAAQRDSAGPPLNANRTMGALGGIVASRVAREFKIGGPAYTSSALENSGVFALQSALDTLRRGDIDVAIVGAVDWSGDLRHVWAEKQRHDVSGVTSGACALVLTRSCPRTRQLLRLDKPPYAKLGANGAPLPTSERAGTRDSGTRDSGTHHSSLQLQHVADAIPATPPRTLERFFDGDELRRISSWTDLNGHGCALSGLAAIVQSCRSLGQRTLPAGFLDSSAEGFPSSPWICDAERSSRHVEITVDAQDGQRGMIRLRAADEPRIDAPRLQREPSVIAGSHTRKAHSLAVEPQGSRDGLALFLLEAETPEKLLLAIESLRARALENPTMPLRQLARFEWSSHPAATAPAQLRSHSSRLTLSLLTQHRVDFFDALEVAEEGVRTGKRIPRQYQQRVFWQPQPLGNSPSKNSSAQPQLAFVYPGSGNHVAGMGRQLGLLFPHILIEQEQLTPTLRAQVQPEIFWRDSLEATAENLIFGQVTFGTFMSDLLRGFGVEPDAAIGYSLGETTSYFSLGVWSDREGMLDRMRHTPLFRTQLAGPCEAARKCWGLPPSSEVNWRVGVVDQPAAIVREQLQSIPHIYLLIVNTAKECVVGGSADGVAQLLEKLGPGVAFAEVHGTTTVHCEIVDAVADAYRELHLFDDTCSPTDIRFYSAARGQAHNITRADVAESILLQATRGFDYPEVIRSAYDDGVRTFVEIGPGNSCSRMISQILEAEIAAGECRVVSCHAPQRGASTGSSSTRSRSEEGTFIEALATLYADGYPVDFTRWFQIQDPLDYSVTSADGAQLQIDTRNHRFSRTPHSSVRPECSTAELEGTPSDTPSPRVPHAKPQPLAATAPDPRSATPPPEPIAASSAILGGSAIDSTIAVPAGPTSMAATPDASAALTQIIEQMARTQEASLAAQETFLRFSERSATLVGAVAEQQLALLRQYPTASVPAPVPSAAAEAVARSAAAPTFPVIPAQIALDRNACLEIAIGSIGKVLGEKFAPIDAHPTRVRLPDEPLMLVDRVLEIDAEPLSMTHGRIVTEHDIYADAWYLDSGRIPTCIAVESGQADLFLSGYLGIDFETRGYAVYRLLDAEVTFHRALPTAGNSIRYDICIERFFRQGDTILFRFSFEATVNGEPLLSMQKGCAGFFTAAELAAGQGIVHTSLDRRPIAGRRPEDWGELVPLRRESYDDAAIAALRAGDLATCFGHPFDRYPVADPCTLPGGRMKLLDRVLELDPTGGRYGLGMIRAELDIHPDDWFLTCHFCDDRVMPGTLMYECCLHTLRVLLLRMGWIGASDEVVHEPIPGVAGQLKCRGQVIESTQKVQYQVSVKEIGYTPAPHFTPYVITDALMFADGRPVVEMKEMSLRLSGLSRETLEQRWRQAQGVAPGLAQGAPEATAAADSHAPPSTDISFQSTSSTPLYDNASILAFAVGKPSEAFGEPYAIFDDKRHIARLPGPPYKFLDRITSIDGEPWKLMAGPVIEAEYDVPSDEWYFEAERNGEMPFAVLLEVALQPCGWLAAYLGSALTSEVDLRFRNLGGSATLLRRVTPEVGTLTTRVKITQVANSAGMIIQHFDFDVRCSAGPVYKGKTYFGFFTQEALANQVGIRDADLYEIPANEETISGPYPRGSNYPDDQLRMVNDIVHYAAHGGRQQLGFVRGTAKVDPAAWFFKAHFYQDPVWPGSLGLESFLQLLRWVGDDKFGCGGRGRSIALGREHRWAYRGQILPTDDEVTIEADLTAVDAEQRILTARGYLSVDGRHIYQIDDFTWVADNGPTGNE